MNIFILDKDVKVSAGYHCDMHVNKMILEAAQILCAVNHKNDLPAPYKLTHTNHPCTIWAGKSLENYLYVMDYAFWLNKEAKRRYSRSIDHKSWLVIENLEFPKLPEIGLTPFAKCVSDEYKSVEDPVEAYRLYYQTKEFCAWRYSEKPSWFLT
jgi:hypothetical protein